MYITKVSDKEVYFKGQYINGDGKQCVCGLSLIVDGDKLDIKQVNREDKDTSKNRLPLWNTLAELIIEAVNYAESIRKTR